MKHKWIYLIIIFMFIFTTCNPGVSLADDTDSNYTYSQRPSEDPNIIIGRDMKIPVFKAGERVSLLIPVENTTGTQAKDFRISLSIGDLKDFPFEIDKMSFTKNISYLSGDSRQFINFYVTVPRNVESKVYPITVNAQYSTDYGSGGSASGTVYVKIENENKKPVLKLADVDFAGDRLPSGKTTAVNLNIKNNGDLPVKDVELHLSGFTANGLNLDKWPDTQNIKIIKANELRPVTFKISVDPEMESGTYTLDLAMKYKDEYDVEYTQESKVYLPVDGKGSHDDLTPRIIMDNYYFDGEYVLAGEVFPLTMSFVNTSEATTVKNIKISLNSDGDVFCPIGSSNSFYIREIEPGGQIEQSIMLKPKVNAECQTYNINADIDYQDVDGNKFNEKEIISIPVTQKIKLNISDVETPPDAYIDSPAGISVDFFNTGRALIRNLTIHTEGDFDTQDGNIYVGNIETGKDDYYDVTITPHKEGKLTGKIIFEYDDDSGKHYIEEKDFNIQVIEQEELPMPDMPEDMQQPETNKWIKWVLPAAGLLLVVGVVLIIRKRRLKKQEEVDFDE